MNAESEYCIQKKVRDFINKTHINWIFICFLLSIIFILPFLFLHSSDRIFISSEITNKILDLLNDVFIGLFGFVGLIIVFVYGNLLTEKRQLEKSEMETNFKFIELRQQITPLKGSIKQQAYTEFSTDILSHLQKFDKELKDNSNRIHKALIYGVLAIGFSVVCIVTNVIAFGTITEKGLHYAIILMLIYFFFLCILFTNMTIRIVIKE